MSCVPFALPTAPLRSQSFCDNSEVETGTFRQNRRSIITKIRIITHVPFDVYAIL